MATFETKITLPATLEHLFDFLVRPDNIRQISPPEMGLAFVDPPEVLALGSHVQFKVQMFGQVKQITHEITELDRPGRFVETQVQGPLKTWVHEHVFESHNDSGVTVIDRIEFEPPGGLVGLLVSESSIRESLEDGFYHRHAELKKHFGEPKP